MEEKSREADSAAPRMKVSIGKIYFQGEFWNMIGCREQCSIAHQP